MDALTQGLLAAGVAFLAEMGDKSQLAVIAMAARGRGSAVFVGSLAAVAVLAAAAATVGKLFMQAVPRPAAGLASAAVFIVAALFMVPWSVKKQSAPKVPATVGAGGAFLVFIIAETGDKTQVGLAALATSGAAVPTAVGGFLGMALNLALAVLIGTRVASSLPARTVRWVAVGLLAVAAGLAILSTVKLPIPHSRS